MAEDTFTFRVDHELKAAFTEVARAQERTAAQLLRLLMRETVQRSADERDHDAWFRNEVVQAVAEADDEMIRRVPHEHVRSNWHQQRAELEKRATDRSA